MFSDFSYKFHLSSSAGPHTIIKGKEVVNFSSADYLGLIGHEKLLVCEQFQLKCAQILCILELVTVIVFLRIHVHMLWRNMVWVHVVLVGFMGQLVRLGIEFKLISAAVCIT